MILAKVVGTVVATRKDPRLVSSKLLIARPMDPKGKPEGNYSWRSTPWTPDSGRRSSSSAAALPAWPPV